MMSKSSDQADYTNEESSKVLGIEALIEAIHEYFDPTSEHDFDYLEKRIFLLRKTFNLGENSTNEKSMVVDRLLSGFGQLPAFKVLPFEGALELPDSLDTEAHIEISKQYGSRLDKIRKSARELRRAYIAFIITHAVESGLSSRTTTLVQLIAEGLPESDPRSNALDF
jgi:hypothetical protein